MKRPDDETVRMLERELDKLVEEVNKDASIAEQILVTMLIQDLTHRVVGLPNSLRRRAFEILYRYFAMIEGLEKK